MYLVSLLALLGEELQCHPSCPFPTLEKNVPLLGLQLPPDPKHGSPVEDMHELPIPLT